MGMKERKRREIDIDRERKVGNEWEKKERKRKRKKRERKKVEGGERESERARMRWCQSESEREKAQGSGEAVRYGNITLALVVQNTVPFFTTATAVYRVFVLLSCTLCQSSGVMESRLTVGHQNASWEQSDSGKPRHHPWRSGTSSVLVPYLVPCIEPSVTCTVSWMDGLWFWKMDPCHDLTRATLFG